MDKEPIASVLGRAVPALQSVTLGSWLVIILSFVLPISTSLTTICMIGIVLVWLFSNNFKQRFRFYLEHPLTPYLWAFIGIVALGLLYTSADLSEAFGSCKDAFRLGLIPLLMYYVQDNKIKIWVGKAFVGAMLITLVLGYCKVYGGLPIGEKYTVGAVFKSHIKTSYFMAIALFFVICFWLQRPKKRGWMTLVILLMLHYLFFLSVGRIGYLALFVLGVAFAWHYWRAKGILTSLLALCLLFMFAYHSSSVFSNRIDLLKQDWAFYQQGGRLIESSLGSRIQFAISSLEIFASSPVWGIGTGSYANAYEAIHQGDKTLLTVNPHNEYLRMMVEGGVLGLVVILALFIKLWQLTRVLPDQQKLIARSILMTFYVGCLLNSWLADFTEAYFFCVFSAVMFAKMKRKKTSWLLSQKWGLTS